MLNIYITQGTNIINPIIIGNKFVQQNIINWSKRNLGKLALIQINVNINIKDLMANVMEVNVPIYKLLFKIEKSNKISIIILYIKTSYPPNSTKLIKTHISIILAYSARKKNTNIAAECSVINPLTNSDSASAKSNGALLVSAIDAIKNIRNKGYKGKINQIHFCISTILVRFKVPLNNTTSNKIELNINS